MRTSSPAIRTSRIAASRIGLAGKNSAPEWIVRTLRAAGVCAETAGAIDSHPATAMTAAGQTRAPGERLISERQPRDELQLPRRTRFSRWQARSRDLAERRAADDVAGWTEVRMVEQVEDIEPELDAGASPEALVLHERQVRIVEGGPDQRISAEIAEAIHGRERRRVEPLVHRADDANRSDEIG